MIILCRLALKNNHLHEVGRVSHSDWRIEQCGEGSEGQMSWWDQKNISGDIQRLIEDQDHWVSALNQERPRCWWVP